MTNAPAEHSLPADASRAPFDRLRAEGGREPLAGRSESARPRLQAACSSLERPFIARPKVVCYSRDERRDELPRPRPARSARRGARGSLSEAPSSGPCWPCSCCARARSSRCERLVDEVWGDDPPPSAAHTLESYVSRLRQLFNGHGPRLVRRGAGYAIELGEASLDARGFVELQERASLAGAMDEHARRRRADRRRPRDVARAGTRRRGPRLGRPRRGRPARGAAAPHVRAPLRRRACARPPRARDRGAPEARRPEPVPGALRRAAHARAVSLRTARGGARRLRADAASARRRSRAPAERRPPAAVRADRAPGPAAPAAGAHAVGRAPHIGRRESTRRLSVLVVAGALATAALALTASGGAAVPDHVPPSAKRARSRPSRARRRRSDLAAEGLATAVDSSELLYTPRDRDGVRRSERARARRRRCRSTHPERQASASSSRSETGQAPARSPASCGSLPETRFVFIDASVRELSLEGAPNAAAIRFSDEDGSLSRGVRERSRSDDGRIEAAYRRRLGRRGRAHRDTARLIAGFKRGLRVRNSRREGTRRLLARARGSRRRARASQTGRSTTDRTSSSPSQAGVSRGALAVARFRGVWAIGAAEDGIT